MLRMVILLGFALAVLVIATSVKHSNFFPFIIACVLVYFAVAPLFTRRSRKTTVIPAQAGIQTEGGQPVFIKPKTSRIPLLLGLIAGLIVGLPILAPGVVPFFIVGGSVGFGVFCFFLCLAVSSGLVAFAITYIIVSQCIPKLKSEPQTR